MNLFAVLGFAATDLADGVLNLTRLQMAAAAHIALIAASGFSAIRTFPFHISVRQIAFAFRTVGQLYLLRIDIAAVHEALYHFLRAIMAGLVVRISKEIKIDAHSFKDFIKVLVVLGRQRFRSHSLGFGVDHDGSPVGVRTAYEQHNFSHFF